MLRGVRGGQVLLLADGPTSVRSRAERLAATSPPTTTESESTIWIGAGRSWQRPRSLAFGPRSGGSDLPRRGFRIGKDLRDQRAAERLGRPPAFWCSPPACASPWRRAPGPSRGRCTGACRSPRSWPRRVPMRMRWGSYDEPQVVPSGARSNRVELNGARSNPRLQVQLSRVSTIHGRLLAAASARPLEPRPAPPRRSPVLETVTLVLQGAGQPMRARDIHAAAEQVAGESLMWTSVKAALSAGTSGQRPRFQRVRYGVYRSAR